MHPVREESGARLVFSNKGDFFPDTLLRVLGEKASEKMGRQLSPRVPDF